MSSKPLMLTGEVDNRDDVIEALQNEVTALEEDLRKARAEAARERRATTMALASLRRTLAPLYQSLQAVFGELDAAGATDEPVGVGTGKWDSIKQKMSPRHREVIDLLLLQGTMRRTQIASALKMDYSNCTKNVIGVLMRQGWLVESGGQISLKQL